MLSATIPFLYSYWEKGYTSFTSLVASVGITGCFGLIDIVLLLLMSSWCATWLELTRHGGFEVVASFEWLLIVFHALLLFYVRLVKV